MPWDNFWENSSGTFPGAFTVPVTDMIVLATVGG